MADSPEKQTAFRLFEIHPGRSCSGKTCRAFFQLAPNFFSVLERLQILTDVDIRIRQLLRALLDILDFVDILLPRLAHPLRRRIDSPDPRSECSKPHRDPSDSRR